MTPKPITVARNDYINAIVQATNKSGLPAFAVAEVLEKILHEVQAKIDTEYKADSAKYRAALQKQNERQVDCDGEQKDK